MDFYFKLKAFDEYILPFVFWLILLSPLILLILVSFFSHIGDSIRSFVNTAVASFCRLFHIPVKSAQSCKEVKTDFSTAEIISILRELKSPAKLCSTSDVNYVWPSIFSDLANRLEKLDKETDDESKAGTE